MKARKKYVGYEATITSGILLILTLILFFPSHQQAIAQSAGVTEKEIRDAILGRSETDLGKMDLNADGRVDVADVVYLKKHPENFGIPIGEHVGTLYRDNGALLEGMRDSFGTIPFAFKVINLFPLQGEIDNTQDDHSLYFPQGKCPVTFIDDPDLDLKASVTFETIAPNLAPDGLLTRTVTFSGSFVDPEIDPDLRYIAGTYEEVVMGFKDNRGNDIEIKITGKFSLVVNRI